MLNGLRPLDALQAGVEHWLRIVNLTGGDIVALELRKGDQLVRWHPVAKDGADLPASQAAETDARVSLGAGEAWDMVWTPLTGCYTLNVDSFNKFTIPVVVRD